MAKVQKLLRDEESTVCSGVSVHDLDGLTKEELVEAMKYQKQAILIVGTDQFAALGVLRSFRRKPFNGWTAERLCKWSFGASLWRVKLAK